MKRILTWILALVLAACCVPAMAEECSHDWNVKEPTCAKNGIKLCKICGATEVLPATGAHNMVVTIEPTCKDEGEQMCSVCGLRESIAKTENHTWKTVEPTCAKDGIKLCSVCGATEALPATGAHNMVVTKTATCAEEGEQMERLASIRLRQAMHRTLSRKWEALRMVALMVVPSLGIILLIIMIST